MSNHTPTPWTHDRYGQLRGSNGVLVNTKRLGLSQELGGSPSPVSEANAAFILKAVNLHDDLLKAALDYRDLIRSDYEGRDGKINSSFAHEYDQLTAIIIRAQETSP